MRQSGWRLGCKVAQDKLVAALLLILLSPLLAVVAIAIYIMLGKPVLYNQMRVGRGCKQFSILKFRSMRDAHDATGHLLPDAERLTPLGIWLRATSIDELPQLWNILRGDMSLVGPRPLPTNFLSKYDDAQMRRHDVVPGVTGWAQVNGRNTLSWENKFALDVWYVEHWRPTLDWHILWRTVPLVFKAEGINNAGHTTSADFKGAKPSGEMS